MRKRWREWAKQSLKVAALTLAAAVALFAMIFLIWVHPNDARIDGPKMPTAAPRRQEVRVKSLLRDRLWHNIDISVPDLAALMDKVRTALPELATMASVRFASPYQIYLPVGLYPARLDARDGLFIPAGKTLLVDPGVVGETTVEFGVYGIRGAAAVTVKVAGGEGAALTVRYEPKTRPFTLPAGIERYWRADQTALADEWKDGRATLRPSSNARFEFTCASDGLGCIVSDVTFTESAPSRENFLIVLVDTLRGDALGAGFAPTMEQFAADAVVFKKALAPGNMTSPSTNAFLGCAKPSDLSSVAFSYGVDQKTREAFYRQKRLSFPARFAKVGYETAMIGNVSVISEAYGMGVDHGFARQISLETEAYDTPESAREAVHWLEANGQKPFLLYLHFNAPHAPYRAPLRDIFTTLRPFQSLRSYPDILYALYQSEVSYTDRYLKLVFEALDHLGLRDRTNVILTADHGDQHELRSYARNAAGPDFGGAYFDHGATLLNDEIGVPLLFRRPSAVHRIVDKLYVSTLDDGPTLLDLAGITQKDLGVDADVAACEGRSLAAVMQGAADESAVVTIGSEGYKGRAILFDNRYKYIKTFGATDKRVYDRTDWFGPMRSYMTPEQLYDLSSDPAERLNLAADNVELLQRARAEYRRFYGIKEAYELVIDDPKGGEIQAMLPIGLEASARVIEGSGDLRKTSAGACEYVGSGSRRILLRFGAPPTTVPSVRVDGRDVPLTFTSLKLPLKVALFELPTEPAGIGSLPEIGRSPAAYLRRVEDEGQEGRRIAQGNPAFEKVLRDWGYLNDR